jgi:uncharacterized membrane protein
MVYSFIFSSYALQWDVQIKPKLAAFFHILANLLFINCCVIWDFIVRATDGIAYESTMRIKEMLTGLWGMTQSNMFLFHFWSLNLLMSWNSSNRSSHY